MIVKNISGDEGLSGLGLARYNRVGSKLSPFDQLWNDKTGCKIKEINMAVGNGNFPDRNDRRYISAAMDAPMLERQYSRTSDAAGGTTRTQMHCTS